MRISIIPTSAVLAALLFVASCEQSASRPPRAMRGDEPSTASRGDHRPVATPAPVRTPTPVVTPAPTPRPAATPDPAKAREAAMREKAAELRRRLPGDFHIRYEWPFVVAGDVSRGYFDRVFEGSLVGSYKILRRDYFHTEPDRLLEVYLFKDDTSYRRYADKLFADDPSTPFGYYSPTHRALIMNIATGTGTLVHELCHPLIDRDFPRCPTWLNEGLASLHEQCTWLDEHLVGLPNWRLPDLQEAIRAGEPLPLKDLIAKTDANGFYRKDKGLNYATARYLCQYLQLRGKLTQFYSRLRRDIEKDPTGQKTIEDLLEAPLSEIEPQWQRWVLTLRFRR